MMAERSKDYHDYVFRDGKLVAEFEDMYRYSEEVPWCQDAQDNWIDVRLTVELFRDIGLFDEIHDLGCGLGYYLNLMKNRLGVKECRGFGYDISETACVSAKNNFPECSFQSIDLTLASSKPSTFQNQPPKASRLFIIRGTLWYVFPKLSNVVKMIRSMMSPGDNLLVVQNFPPLDSSFVGKEVMPNHSALIRHFAGLFLPIRHLWYEDTIKGANDNWFIGLFSLSEKK
jgi:SAM-dependent methyltransferase